VLPGQLQLVVDVDGRSVLKEFAQAGAGVGEAPTGGLDTEMIQRGLDLLALSLGHKQGGNLQR
jgi:hypothetical protein